MVFPRVSSSMPFDFKVTMDWLAFWLTFYGKSVAIVMTGIASYHALVVPRWSTKIFLVKWF